MYALVVYTFEPHAMQSKVDHVELGSKLTERVCKGEERFMAPAPESRYLHAITNMENELALLQLVTSTVQDPLHHLSSHEGLDETNRTRYGLREDQVPASLDLRPKMMLLAASLTFDTSTMCFEDFQMWI